MKSFMRTLGVAVLAMAALAAQAGAGRTGGPAAERGTIAAGKSFWFDVELDEGRAVIAATSSGPLLGMSVYDGDGNVFASQGDNRQRAVAFTVTRAGFFRVEVRNNGGAADVTLRTN